MGKFQKGFSGESVQISLYCTLFLEVEVPSLSLSFGAVSFRCYVVSARNMMEWRAAEKRRRLEEMDVLLLVVVSRVLSRLPSEFLLCDYAQ